MWNTGQVEGMWEKRSGIGWNKVSCRVEVCKFLLKYEGYGHLLKSTYFVPKFPNFTQQVRPLTW